MAALALLISHTQCAHLETPTDWRDVAQAARLLGSTSRAVASNTRAPLLPWAGGSKGARIAAACPGVYHGGFRLMPFGRSSTRSSGW